MPEVWFLRRSLFVGDWRVDDSDPADVERIAREEVGNGTEGWIRASVRLVLSAPTYAIADIRGSPDDVAMVQWQERDEEWEVVGGYICDTLWLDPFHRGRGLSAEIVLAKADKLNGTLTPESYTSAGKAAHEAAHRLAVSRALMAGFKVPAAVLADYPHLVRRKVSAA